MHTGTQNPAGRFHQTAMSGLRRGKASIGIRMTPMIDVIFLLLTFFVLTAKFQEPEQILPILMGTANAHSTQTPRTPLAIYIKPAAGGCTVAFENGPGIELSGQDLGPGLLNLTGNLQGTIKNGGNQPIELYCDDAVAWDVVVKIYDILYALGARDITFRIDQ